MTQIEVLDESVSWPFIIPPGRSGHDGVPPSVAVLSISAKPWHLVGWRDSSSNTIGIVRQHQAITIGADDVDSLSVCFMRRAKGPGFVSLEAKVRGNQSPVVLFEVNHFDEDALLWLRTNAHKFEALFDVPTSVNDYGADY